ncbi:hypothetical protein FHT76_002146 [Rhizobium sp. BK176]|nr:hypothetical protein [Rhizobium sp. BK176]
MQTLPCNFEPKAHLGAGSPLFKVPYVDAGGTRDTECLHRC